MKVYVMTVLVALFSLSGCGAGRTCESAWEAAPNSEAAYAVCYEERSDFALSKQYEIGNQLYYEWDYAEAAKWLRLAAEQRSAAGQFLLGQMYYHGRGVVQNNEEAVRLYRLAAQQGYADAQSTLGVMHFFGIGRVAQNYAEAAKWFRLAAEQGDADAQSRLGGMHLDGLGVLKDPVYAHMWANIAAANGERRALETRSKAERNMTREQIAEAQRLALECVSKDYKNC